MYWRIPLEQELSCEKESSTIERNVNGDPRAPSPQGWARSLGNRYKMYKDDFRFSKDLLLFVYATLTDRFISMRRMITGEPERKNLC